jgi:hypothetical protein
MTHLYERHRFLVVVALYRPLNLFFHPCFLYSPNAKNYSRYTSDFKQQKHPSADKRQSRVLLGCIFVVGMPRLQLAEACFCVGFLPEVGRLFDEFLFLLFGCIYRLLRPWSALPDT